MKVLEKIEAKRRIALLSKDLEEDSKENCNSPFGKFIIKTKTNLLERSKRRLAKLEKEERKNGEHSKDDDKTGGDNNVNDKFDDVTKSDDEVADEDNNVTEALEIDVVNDHVHNEKADTTQVTDDGEVTKGDDYDVTEEYDDVISQDHNEIADKIQEAVNDIVEIDNVQADMIDNSRDVENNNELLDCYDVRSSEHINKDISSSDSEKTFMSLTKDADKREFYENFFTLTDIDVINQETKNLSDLYHKCVKNERNLAKMTAVQKLIVNLDLDSLETKAKKLSKLVSFAPVELAGFSFLKKKVITNRTSLLARLAKERAEMYTKTSEKLQKYYKETGKKRIWHLFNTSKFST